MILLMAKCYGGTEECCGLVGCVNIKNGSLLENVSVERSIERKKRQVCGTNMLR